MQRYTEDDYLLWEQVREGSAESFNVLYEKYWQVVYEGAMKRLKDYSRAQDITQEVFVTLWIKREELQINNFPAYLHIATRNRVLNLLEKEKRFVPLSRLLEFNRQAYGDRADAVALRNEFLEAYKRLIDTLPEQRKKIFRLYYDEGLPTDEIAQRLALSRKTVQNQLGRAVSFLKINLSQLFLLLLLLSMGGNPQ